MRLNKCMALSLILTAIFLLAGCSSSKAKSIQPERGVLNLDGWDFKKDGNIELDGEWEFYWSRLLTYSDFESGKQYDPIIAPVPMAWTEYNNGGARLPGRGFGTYRLHLKTNLPAGTLMSFRINTFSSSYRMYIDDREIASNGVVSDSESTYTPQYKPLTAVFNVPDDEFDIIIQVANYHFYRGGFWYGIYIGTVDNIRDLQNYLIGKELFIIGAFSMMALYYISMFLIRKNERMYIYFAVICMLVILVFDILGEVLICRVLPGIPFNSIVFIWYSSIQWMPYFLILYSGELFPLRYNSIVSRIYGTLTVLITVLFMVTPSYFYTQFGRIGDFIILFGVAYSIAIAVVGLKQRRHGAGLYILAAVVLLITATHDELFLSNIINSKIHEIAFIGVFVLLFVHTLIHIKRSADEYNDKVRLLAEVESSKKISIINERKFLQAQIKPHFLYNTLSVIASLSTKDPMQTRELIVDLAEYLRSSFDFDSVDDLVPIYKEIELVKAYVAIQKARFKERVNFELNCDNIPEIRIPRLSIQPLVENAIQHGILKKTQGGTVVLDIKINPDSILIEVSDDGNGMTADWAEELLTKSETRRGVGIKNINIRLISLYGKGLYIRSQVGKGTSCGFKIPVNKDIKMYEELGCK